MAERGWRPVFVDSAIAAAFLGAGFIVAGRFEERTPIPLRLLRPLLFIGVTAFISAKKGRRWALTFVFGWLALAVGFHAWWTHAHGIELLRPEPRDRYYKARGWTFPDAGSP